MNLYKLIVLYWLRPFVGSVVIYTTLDFQNPPVIPVSPYSLPVTPPEAFVAFMGPFTPILKRYDWRILKGWGVMIT